MKLTATQPTPVDKSFPVVEVNCGQIVTFHLKRTNLDTSPFRNSMIDRAVR
jgi:hypothetical protein